MHTSESLRRTIAVTEELQSVVKTMKALAGVNIRQYERAAHAVAEYNHSIEMGLQIALQRLHVPAHAPEKISALELSQQGLLQLAEDTGGFATVNGNGLSDALQRIEEEQRGYYLIGFKGPEKIGTGNQGSKAAYHSLKGTVTRQDM